MKLALLLLFTILFTSSCSNYIAKIHREIDKDNRVQNKRSRKQDNLSHIKRSQRRNKYKRRRGLISSRQMTNRYPSTKRRYKNVKKRMKADDLNDNGSDGSLWSGRGRYNNFLFSSDERKKHGDIVVINVASSLKNEITRELKHAFPLRKSKKKNENKKAPASEANANENGEKYHDKISTVVLEEVKKDHLLVRGRKFLIYRKRKRQVEVQALISRRDVGMDDAISSDDLIEKSIRVLK